MSRLAIASVALSLSGCAKDMGTERDTSHEVVAMQAPVRWSGSTAPVWLIHDDARGVTCWVTNGGYQGSSPALSCLPDSQLKDPTNE